MRKTLFASLMIIQINASNYASAQNDDFEHPLSIQIRGSLDTSETFAAIKPRMTAVQTCYNRFLKSLPAGNKASGRVTVRYEVDKSGKVDSLRLYTTAALDNKKLKRCIGKSLKKLTFPKAPTPSRIDFPFDLVAD